MTSAAESVDVELNDNEPENLHKHDVIVQEQTAEFDQGRVRRRTNATTQADGQNAGPVLRTTVKPVKRFRPDSNTDKSNPSPSRKKRLKTSNSTVLGRSNSDDCVVAQGEGSSRDNKVKNGIALLSSPERKATNEVGTSKGEKVESSGNLADGAPTRKKRVWEQWSVEDKNYFFEAVAMYGKDFETIRTAIEQKHRKRGEQCVAKTKDQVRHLYYRTWTMISKIIDATAYPININKAFQELYAVINYGEIRKKLGGNLKKKGIEKLNELIRDGTTSARVKGKNFRIKTPSCKALKKMNPDYQGKEGMYDLPLVSDTRRMKIPLHVIVELIPLTMAAWNQVHSIAHNPRLRIRLSVESQLSSIFTYLEKKWKPLSGRLIKVANQCQSKNNNSAANKILSPNSSSIWEDQFVLQTPPDASVNTRIMVFQVANNKTHCVVSYALRKCMQQNLEKIPENLDEEKKPVEVEINEQKEIEECDNNEVLNGALSESEVIDSCSEEDFDYDSANEDALKMNGKDESDQNDKSMDRTSPVNGTDILDSPKGDCEYQSLDTSFVMKEKECNGLFSPDNLKAESDNQSDENNEIDKIIKDTSPAPIDDLPCETVVANSTEITSIENSDDENEINHTPITITEDTPADDITTTEVTEMQESEVGSKSDTEVEKYDDVVKSDNDKIMNNAIDSISSEYIITNTVEATIDADETENASKDKKLVLSTKLFGKAAETKKRKTSKNKKSSTKAVQMWTTKDCRKTTIAEIYMLLGKPSVFKLCYHWLQTSAPKIDSEDHESPIAENTTEKESCVPFTTGLMALIQMAKLTSLGVKQEDEKVEKSVAETRPKSPTTKNTATQCNILKPNQKSDDSNQPSTTTTSTSTNPHGRGVSKVIPVQTMIVDNIPMTGFAIPAAPINRPRRIAVNPNKPVQGTKVSPETINWLLNRDRQRTTRQLRRPIVMLGRSSNNYKPMKTFSIVTRGPNKVGFQPSKPVYAPAQCSSVPGQGSSSGSIISNASVAEDTPSTGSSLDIESFLGLDDASVTPSNIMTSDLGNLLHQAAKEAGVAPPTPVKTPTDNMETSCENSDKTINRTDYLNTEAPSDIYQKILERNLNQQPGTLEELVYRSSFTTASSITTTTSAAQTPMSPSISLTALAACPVAIDSLLDDISWQSHDIAPSAFSVINEDSLMGNLVDGENDVVLSSLNTEEDKTKKSDSSRSFINPSPIPGLDENSNGPSLTRDNFDLHMTPVKSSDLPIHPWTISTHSRDSMGLGGLLNTPQKMLPSDTEDSLDGLFGKKGNLTNTTINTTRELRFSPTAEMKKTSTSLSKSRHISQDQSSTSNFLSGSDPEVDLQLQCMLNENSVDYIAKFQDLVRQTTECDELSGIGCDENARDGHHQAAIPALSEFNLNRKEVKDNG